MGHHFLLEAYDVSRVWHFVFILRNTFSFWRRQMEVSSNTQHHPSTCVLQESKRQVILQESDQNL